MISGGGRANPSACRSVGSATRLFLEPDYEVLDTQPMGASIEAFSDAIDPSSLEVLSMLWQDSFLRVRF